MNLILFAIFVFILNQLGYFFSFSIITNFFLFIGNYLSLFLLIIIIGFIAWCFQDA